MAKEKCLRCDASWERRPSEERHPGPRCGESKWDEELSLDNYVGARGEYAIVRESMDNNMVLSLELKGVGIRHAPVAPLSHRMKKMYRHQKGDIGAKDGRGLIVIFDRASSGADKGKWVIARLYRKPDR